MGSLVELHPQENAVLLIDELCKTVLHSLSITVRPKVGSALSINPSVTAVKLCLSRARDNFLKFLN